MPGSGPVGPILGSNAWRETVEGVLTASYKVTVQCTIVPPITSFGHSAIESAGYMELWTVSQATHELSFR